METYVEAVLTEARLRFPQVEDLSLSTIFIGGGTPSLLPPLLLKRLIEGLRGILHFHDAAEFTCEANPGTLTQAWLETAFSLGVNRLSLGMQASQERLLKLLGRIHTKADVEASVSLARGAGFQNLNLDLMFGLPMQTMDDWLDTLRFALSLAPQHLSCYGLILEDGTRMKEWVDTGKLTLPDESEERDMYDAALRMLGDHGFHQYEISNFARDGFLCRHNMGYWRQVYYLGLGSSSASMLPSRKSNFFCVREKNPDSLDEYLSLIAKGQVTRKREEITPEDARFETMMLGLRTTEGVRYDDFEHLHGVTLQSCYGEKIQSLIRKGLLEMDDLGVRLTRTGMDLQNQVLVELMDD